LWHLGNKFPQPFLIYNYILNLSKTVKFDGMACCGVWGINSHPIFMYNKIQNVPETGKICPTWSFVAPWECIPNPIINLQYYSKCAWN
jgi:hypothetical protein